MVAATATTTITAAIYPTVTTTATATAVTAATAATSAAAAAATITTINTAITATATTIAATATATATSTNSAATATATATATAGTHAGTKVSFTRLYTPRNTRDIGSITLSLPSLVLITVIMPRLCSVGYAQTIPEVLTPGITLPKTSVRSAEQSAFMFCRGCGFRVRVLASYRTPRSFGSGYGSVTELPEVPGIVAQAYRTHRRSGRVQNIM